MIAHYAAHPSLNLIFLNDICVGLWPVNTTLRSSTNKVIVAAFRSMGFTDKGQYLINLPGRKDIEQTNTYYSKEKFETRYGERDKYRHQLVFEFIHYYDKVSIKKDQLETVTVNRFAAINRKFRHLYDGGYPCMFLLMPTIRNSKKFFYVPGHKDTYENMWFCDGWVEG